MVTRGAALAVCATLAVESPVRAQDDQATALSGVGVSLPKVCIVAHDPPNLDVPAPKLVSTYPAQGQMVRPGIVILRLRFDLPMGCRPPGVTKPAVLETRPPDPCATDHVQHWVLLKERFDWTVLCRLQPKTRYVFRLNHFKGLSGRDVEPYTLTFDTSDAPPVTTIEHAVALDTLRSRAAPVKAAAE